MHNGGADFRPASNPLGATLSAGNDTRASGYIPQLQACGTPMPTRFTLNKPQRASSLSPLPIFMPLGFFKANMEGGGRSLHPDLPISPILPIVGGAVLFRR